MSTPRTPKEPFSFREPEGTAYQVLRRTDGAMALSIDELPGATHFDSVSMIGDIALIYNKESVSPAADQRFYLLALPSDVCEAIRKNSGIEIFEFALTGPVEAHALKLGAPLQAEDFSVPTDSV